jgi:hypothetical protein
MQGRVADQGYCLPTYAFVGILLGRKKEKAMAESEGEKDGERQKWSHLCCAD